MLYLEILDYINRNYFQQWIAVLFCVCCLFAFSACASLSQQSVVPAAQSLLDSETDSTSVTKNEGVYPHGPTCGQLAQAEWNQTSLYELTYGCIPKGWRAWFDRATIKNEIKKISDELANSVDNEFTIEPDIGNTFRAFYEVAPEDIKVVILGQDPAPQRNLATGLSFSTEEGVHSSKVSSIQRVLLEAKNGGYCVDLENGNLEKWANRGALLLNMALSIRCEKSEYICDIGSHIELWNKFTQDLITYINNEAKPTAFVLWGSKARAYKEHVTNENHTVISGSHPSPRNEATGKYFFCRNYYNCANKWLEDHGRERVDWNLVDQCTVSEPCFWAWNSETRSSSCQSRCTVSACQ